MLAKVSECHKQRKTNSLRSIITSEGFKRNKKLQRREYCFVYQSNQTRNSWMFTNQSAWVQAKAHLAASCHQNLKSVARLNRIQRLLRKNKSMQEAVKVLQALHLEEESETNQENKNEWASSVSAKVFEELPEFERLQGAASKNAFW